MKATKTDPIIDELRAVRDKHAARCGHDVEAIFRDIRARQQASQRQYVSLPPRRVLAGLGGKYRPAYDSPIPRATRQPDEERTAAASAKEETKFGYYMIGVFDVLGQSTKLQAQSEIPVNNAQFERQRVVANLKDTAGVVIGFRKLFRRFFEAAGQPTGSGLADSLPGPQRAEMLAAMASEILLWGVSDTIFVAVPLAWTRHPAARAGDVFRSLLAAGSMWLLGLSTNHPLRGGMEIGTGIDIEPGEIYGQALEAAYHLESKVASLPRIVVGPKCVEFLEAVKRSETRSDTSSRLATRSADLCLSMLRKDTDGHTVVDGLGQTMLDQFRDVPDSREQFSQAHENVRAQCRNFHDAGNAKLASRYELLRTYFDERAPQWQATLRTEP